MTKKGQAKNTKNKAKHSKLMNRKKKKSREDKIAHSERLKAIVKKSQEQSKN